MKRIFRIIVLLSIVFLVIKLIQADYLKVPEIFHVDYLIFSFLALFAGMVFNTLNWWAILSINKHPVKIKDGIISAGLSIFAKYIPGKVMLILGRAEYISNNYEIKRETSSALSLQTQIITLWIGFTLGCLGLFLIDGFSKTNWLFPAIGIWIFLSLFIFLPIVKVVIEKVVKVVIKKEVDLPSIAPSDVFRSVPYFLANWGFWSLGFYFLCKALLPAQELSVHAGLAFPLGGTAGIIAIIAPGGIGVREGVLAFYLNLMGLDLADATTISVASRLWFLIGETFIFLLSMLIAFLSKRPS